jgi:hypothetical protein
MKRIQIEPIGDRDTLMQSPPEVLVEIILRQQQMIEQLVEEVERLKQQGKQDSQSSSQPPSSDLLQRSENPPVERETEKGCSALEFLRLALMAANRTDGAPMPSLIPCAT